MADVAVGTLAFAAGLGVADVAALATAGVHRLRVENTDVPSAHLPDAFDGVRILFMSDVHAGFFMPRSRVASLVDEVNALQPDLALLGGDYVGGYGRGADAFYPEIARLVAPLGRYGVLGNHDAWEGAAEARTRLAEAGITLLENANAAVERGGARIFVAGVEDLDTGAPDAVRAAEGISAGDFAVLVTHNPDVLAVELPRTAQTWDLVLAGHTHGGQVLLLGRVPVTRPTRFGSRYLSGWKRERGVPILVSNGVGTSMLPVRLFAHPQVHLLTLRRV